MSIDVADESGPAESPEDALDPLRISTLARFVMDRMRVHPQAELSVIALDRDAMAALHTQYMDLEGPTDVLSFEMDELRPGSEDKEPEPGLLGDVVLCPSVAVEQAKAAGHSTADELDLLTTHGILHLLGFDHEEPDEEQEMFGLQREIVESWSHQRAEQGQP